jgi:hypothetical protein
MRGPGERLKYDFRRVWECPVCRHRERTGGDVTFRLCACQRKVDPPNRAWMKLVQEGGRRAESAKPEISPPTPIESSELPPLLAPELTDATLADPVSDEPPDLTQPID